MRTFSLLFGLFFCCFVTFSLQAQDPGAQQDAEAAREKLLKAEDQLDNIQVNSETTRTAVDGMKTDVTKLQADIAALQADNGTLKQQLADLQAAFDKSEAARAKERQVLLDEVAKMVAAGNKGSSTTKPSKKKESLAPPADSGTTSSSTKPSDTAASTTDTTPETSTTTPADTGKTTGTASSASDTSPEPVKMQKGYYHIVASGETLTLICNAYREEGVHVTVAEIKKANSLTDKSVLKVGQKLFIPKPGN